MPDAPGSLSWTHDHTGHIVVPIHTPLQRRLLRQETPARITGPPDFELGVAGQCEREGAGDRVAKVAPGRRGPRDRERLDLDPRARSKCRDRAWAPDSGHDGTDDQAGSGEQEGPALVLRFPRVPQRLAKRRRIGPAIAAFQLERPPQRPGDVGRDARPVAFGGFAFRPAHSRQRFVDHHPRGVHVGQLVRLHTCEQLGGHVERGALPDPGIGLLFVGEPAGNAEVGEDCSVNPEEQIAGLDVAVDDPLAVRSVERRQQVASQLSARVDGQASVLFQVVLEGFALQVFHHVEVEAVPLVDLVDRHDVGVPQGGQDLRFPHEPLCGCRGPQLLLQDLDRPQAVERNVADQEHGPHAATAELAQQLVVGRQCFLQTVEEGGHGGLDRETSGALRKMSNGARIRQGLVADHVPARLTLPLLVLTVQWALPFIVLPATVPV